MLDYNKINIGDTVICTIVGYTDLKLNEKYIISDISIKVQNGAVAYFVNVNGHREKFFTYRFKFDLKTSRKNKLKQILINNA